MRRELALIAAVLAVATPLAVRHAAAIEPLGAGEFNVKAKVDLKSLDRADFIALLNSRRSERRRQRARLL